MVAKLAIYVCPVPGCATIASKEGTCPSSSHPNKLLVREIYIHQQKIGQRPGDLGGRKAPFDLGNMDFGNMGDILGNLFGETGKGKTS